MLLQSIDILFDDPATFVMIVVTFLATAGVALLIGITVHEFSHAAAAYRLGDPTARHLGRLSLNPVRHLDPMGTAMLLLVGFGWGKPVPVSPRFLRNDTRKSMSLVASAGPMANVITALACGLPIRMGLLSWHSPFSFRGLRGASPEDLLVDLLGFVIFFNIILAVFNLIPLSPLDGSKIAAGVLPASMAATLARWDATGPAILMAIIMIDWFTGLNLLWGVLGPLADVVGLIAIGRSL